MTPFKNFEDAVSWLQEAAQGPTSVLLINESEVLSGSFTLRSRKYKENLQRAIEERKDADTGEMH